MSAIREETDILTELRRAIDARQGTRADFAKTIGIGQVYLSQILSGRRSFSRLPIETGRKISEVSGISLDRLATIDVAKTSLARGGDAD
jgi:transcriptional regulator with XRE-family HTH domain